MAHELLNSPEIVIDAPGYVYIFLSNEEATPIDVYFDDFKVTYVKSPVISTDDYYPFGLTFNSYKRENSVENKIRFQGQEHVDDLGLNWDSFKWRNHIPEIGRFFNLDSLSEKYYYNSPYAFSENKVVAHRELEGLESYPINPRANPLHYMARNMGDYFKGAGRLIDKAGAQIQAFFSFGADEEGTSGGVKGNISNETRTTFTMSTTAEDFFTPTSDNKPSVSSPFKLDIQTTNETKVTVSGKITIEGVDVHAKNVTSTNTATGETTNTTTVTVGKDQTGVFVETGTNGTRGGLRTEHKVPGFWGSFIKFGGSLSFGTNGESLGNN